MLLNIENLKTFFYNEGSPSKAVNGVSFSIDKKETFCLVGESGSGKSVTALSVMQLVSLDAGYYEGGKIEFIDQSDINSKEANNSKENKMINLLSLKESEKKHYRGNQISMIFQEPMTSLNPVLTVGYQLSEPLIRHQNLSKSEARQKSIELLKQVNIPDATRVIDDYPHQLSGGMKQRIMIAMALACQPDLLIADEPTTALDVTIQAQILDLMKDLQKKKGTSILFITHDLAVVSEIADKVAVMYAGKIVEIADKKTLFSNPAHPYTLKLLKSVPSITNKQYQLETVEGRVPLVSDLPEGCAFAKRCHVAIDECFKKEPILADVENNHQVSCLLYKHESAKTVFDKIKIKDKKNSRNIDHTKTDVLLDIKALKVYYPIKKGIFRKTVAHVKAVDEIDLQIKRGRTLAVVGESGCGKTTLGKSILQLIHPTAGRLNFNGVELIDLDQKELHDYRKKMQIIFQDPYSSLNPKMMISEILIEGMTAHRLYKNKKERIQVAKDLMEKVGLEASMLYRYPHEFSGGQRQRIGVARTLALKPEFIVCDEATSALDVSVQAQILNLLEELQDEFNLTYLFISHNLAVVEYIADEVAVMYLGRIVEKGSVEEIFQNPVHPYTKALMSAVPEINYELLSDQTFESKKQIRLLGELPSAVNPPSGCYFHPRCPVVKKECSQVYPKTKQLSETHFVNCILK